LRNGFVADQKEVSSGRAAVKRLDSRCDMWSPLDPEFDQESLLSSPTNLSSLSSSIFPTDLPAIDTHGHRRSSFTSSNSSMSHHKGSASSARTASPATPAMGSSIISDLNAHYLKLDVNSRCHPIHRQAEDSCWMSSTPRHGLAMLGRFSDLQTSDPLATSDVSLHGTASHLFVQGMMNNPTLSRSIFKESSNPAAMFLSKDELLPWTDTAIQHPPQIIVPSAAFQPVLSSSPEYKHEPSTPPLLCAPPSIVLSSSPLSMVSTAVVPSQDDVEDFLHERALVIGNRKRHRPNTDRLLGRGRERKRPTGGGINCNAVIARNEFACSYSGCIDKNTGKQKRFKRQEHKRRHEKTVHEKTKHKAYKCWVPLCETKPFSRTDNLKSHLRNTHGKKSATQRNRYVATLDKHSEFYDPEWIGDLDGEGYPIR